MNWELIDSGVNKASLQMEKDRELLKNLNKEASSFLHFYDFTLFTITYGYFSNPEKFLNFEFIKEKNIELTKRATGGGMSFHFFDFTFSILIPALHPHFSLNTLKNYAFINGIVKNALQKFLGKKEKIFLFSEENKSILEENFSENAAFCMAKPISHDLMLNGLKIGGGAERLTKKGVLHQGTLNLRPKDLGFLEELIGSPSIFQAIKNKSSSLFKEQLSDKELESVKQKLKECFISAFFEI